MRRPIVLIVLLVLLTAVAFAENNQLNLVSTLVRGKVYHKSDIAPVYQLTVGQNVIPSGTVILSYLDGQCFFQRDKTLDLRLKEDSNLAFVASSSFELRKGIMGVKIASYPVLVTTPHLKIELADALVVIKVNPVLTRVCVIRGKAVVWQGKSRDKIVVSVNNEIAAAPGRLSKLYPRSDELRFTWYWVEPEKEPGLQ